jgi:hypothetical protein
MQSRKSDVQCVLQLPHQIVFFRPDHVEGISICGIAGPRVHCIIRCCKRRHRLQTYLSSLVQRCVLSPGEHPDELQVLNREDCALAVHLLVPDCPRAAAAVVVVAAAHGGGRTVVIVSRQSVCHSSSWVELQTLRAMPHCGPHPLIEPASIAVLQVPSWR